MRVPTIASGSLRKVLAACRDLKLDGAQILTDAGIDPALTDDRDARVPIPRWHAIWELMAARTARPDCVLVAAGNYQPDDYGLVGFVLMTSTTIEEGMGHFVRYVGLWTDEPAFTRDGTIVRASYGFPFPDSAGKRLAMESVFTEIVHGARALTGAQTVPRAVRFAHRAPADPEVYDRFYGCKVEFDADATEIEFRAEDLALPFRRADAKLGAFLRETANKALAQREADAGTPLDRARRIIAEELARTMPSIESVARRMATTPRTLRRRLAEAGTSFRKLLDETRAELARVYVRDRRIPMSEVAFLLGFSEPSTFHRAFKRWTRTTPAAWRAQG
jgi:AraC-like DNA-binding protein